MAILHIDIRVQSLRYAKHVSTMLCHVEVGSDPKHKMSYCHDINSSYWRSLQAGMVQ